MASSDEDAPTPKRARGSGKVQRGRKIPFLTFTEERSYPPDYDYTRVLDYFSDEDREESRHEEEEEEEEVGDDSDADASDDGDVGGGDGDDDGDSSDDDDDDDDGGGVDYGYREDREFEKEQRGKQVRRAVTGRLTRGRGCSRGRGRARGEGCVGGGEAGEEESVVYVLADVVQGGGRVMEVMGIFQGKMMSGLTMIPPPRKWSLLVTLASPVIGLHLPLDLFSCSSQGLC